MKGGTRGEGWGFKTVFPWGREKRNWLNCNQWPAMLDLKSLFDIGVQGLKYYFYVSVSYDGNVFSLAKFGRLGVSNEYVEFCVVVFSKSF